ncbi:MAG: hypothetical protein IJ315_07725, partial [Firmicutes bacterium]|nr:hypothetical protein [Bacillota bacterium]
LLNESMNLPKDFTEDIILKNPTPDIMNKLAKCVLALYADDPNPDELSLPKPELLTCLWTRQRT